MLRKFRKSDQGTIAARAFELTGLSVESRIEMMSGALIAQHFRSPAPEGARE